MILSKAICRFCKWHYDRTKDPKHSTERSCCTIQLICEHLMEIKSKKKTQYLFYTITEISNSIWNDLRRTNTLSNQDRLQQTESSKTLRTDNSIYHRAFNNILILNEPRTECTLFQWNRLCCLHLILHSNRQTRFYL